MAQKPKLFKVQLVIKDVTPNAPGRPRCFLCLSIGQHGYDVSICITSGERSLEREGSLGFCCFFKNQNAWTLQSVE